MKAAASWVLVGTSVGAVVLGTVFAMDAEFEASSVAWILVGPLPILLLGAYLLWRRPGHPIAEMLIVMAAAAFVIPLPLEAWSMARYAESGPQPWMWWPMAATQLLGLLAIPVATMMVALLTDGRYHHRREKWVLRSLWVVLLLVPIVAMTSEFAYHHEMAFRGLDDVPSPLYLEALAPLGSFAIGLQEATPLIFLGGIVLLLMRYRTASVRERRRLRWVLFGGAMIVAFGIWPSVFGALGVLPELQHGALATVFFLPVLMLPVSLVVAIDEPSWVDVDIVVNKTFVYGALSFFILLLYVAVASASGIAAGSRVSLTAAIIITVAAAIAFQPVRNWLQNIADRWVFGDRPTRYEAVTGFTSSLGGTEDPAELLGLMADLILRAVGTRWVTIDLTEGASVQKGSLDTDPALEMAMTHGADHYGVIRCGAKVDGRFSDDDLSLINTLAAQAALAISNTQLAGRIVTAQEAERRRIERNLHDGAQQELVALVARLGMARSELEHGDLDPAAVDELRAEAMHILADLRELAQGIHPSVLSDGGLLEAVEDCCVRAPIDVRIEAAESLRLQRFPADVESAAYFFVAEGLGNILKHSRATEARIGIERTDGMLSIWVSDNGDGFDPGTTPVRGLAGLRDRITALGGSMTIGSGNGGGTALTAALPVDR